MHHQLSSNLHESMEWLDGAAHAIVEAFADEDNEDGNDDDEAKASKSSSKKLKKSKDGTGGCGEDDDSIWIVPYLVRHLKFLQTR